MSFELVQSNLLSPVVLCFVLGAVGRAIRSDFALPDAVFQALSITLMLSIGLRGGAELAHLPVSQIAAPAAGALLLGCAIPFWVVPFLRRVLGLGLADAAAMAAHYGSVSAVTFAAVQTMLERQGTPFEPYVAALLALMEVPAIVVSLLMARSGGSPRMGAVLHEAFAGKSVLLLGGGLIIGALSGPAGIARVKPFFFDPFQGLLCLFLLELGRVAAGQARDFAKVGWPLVMFAILAPVLHAMVAVVVAKAAGMGLGGAVVLAALAASASYIAAPAAVRLALPQANAGIYLTSSLAITFPFNIALGLPLYDAMARFAYAP